jgi:hypothetical protein
MFLETHEDKTDENDYGLRLYVQFMQLFKKFGLTTYLKCTLTFFLENITKNLCRKCREIKNN